MAAYTRVVILSTVLFAMLLPAAPPVRAQAGAAGQSGADKIVFKVVPGSEPGLKTVMEEWQARERERPGGKFKDSREQWPHKIIILDYDNDGQVQELK